MTLAVEYGLLERGSACWHMGSRPAAVNHCHLAPYTLSSLVLLVVKHRVLQEGLQEGSCCVVLNPLHFLSCVQDTRVTTK